MEAKDEETWKRVDGPQGSERRVRRVRVRVRVGCRLESSKVGRA
jgi:hypothetical protein